MVVADLHVHTTNSDGSMTLDEVPDAARRAGVEAVAITDHDRVHPAIDAPVVERDGSKLIHGIELRVEAPPFRVDLLGYGVEPTAELRAELDRLQRNRIERGRAIVEQVESKLGIDLGVEVEEGFGRPHVAEAIDAHPGTELSYRGAFEELIGDDGPCYVARDVPSFERGRKLLADSCAIVGLAHPFRYPDTEAALALTEDLDAVERWYPYDREVDVTLVEDVIDRYDLLATGGSDAHDDTLGRAGLDEEAFEPIEQALPSQS